MAHEKLKPTYEFTENKIKALKKILPEAFEDGKINFDTLRECLGDLVEDSDDERFGLVWPGKKEARRLAAIPSKGTLVPIYGEGLKADGTPDTDGVNDSKNIFIEGENLEVLKILQKSYAGRIKMIYIDPPYNTGNDFIYDDNFTEPLEHYLRRTGQVDDDGKALTTNKKSDGRFHSKWLDMMYPRLKLARELLSDDGLIFVSIDDNEVYHLGQVLDELFGSTNKLACAPWLSEASGGKEKTGLRTGHEYLLIYYKNSSESVTQEERSTGVLNSSDKFGPYRKGRELMKWGGTSLRKDRPNQFYPLPTPENTEVLPYRNDGKEGHWRWGKTNPWIEKAIQDPEIFHWESRPFNDGVKVNNQSSRLVPYEKIRDTKKSTGWSTWLDKYGTNADGTREIKELFEEKVFDTPKPTSLLKWILSLHSDDNLIALDFFSGSASLAHAVMAINQEDHGNRNFICVQVPFKVSKDTIASEHGYNDICEIARDRIKRASQKLVGLKDNGFKTFNLKQGQLINKWSGNIDDLFKSKKQWVLNELIFEIIISEGFPLDSNIESILISNTIIKIGSDWHNFNLQICLDDKIEESTIEDIELGDDVFICFDDAITDQGKLRLSDKGLIKTIG